MEGIMDETKKFIVVDGLKQDVGFTPPLIRMTKRKVKELQIFPGPVIFSYNKKTAKFNLAFDTLNMLLKENEVALTYDARKLLNIEIGDKITFVKQVIDNLQFVDLMELVVVKSPPDDVGQKPSIARISRDNMFKLKMYENDFIRVQSSTNNIQIKVKSWKDINSSSVSLCREDRENLNIIEGKKIIVRQETLKERIDYFLQVLKRIDFMQTFNEEELLSLAKNIKREEYRGREIIFRQGEKGDAMYIIDSGSIEVSIKSNLGTKQIIAFLKKGDLIGEMGLLTEQKRIATAIAVTDCNLLILNKSTFDNIFITNPVHKQEIEKIVKSRHKEVTNKIKELEKKELNFLEDLKKEETGFFKRLFKKKK